MVVVITIFEGWYLLGLLLLALDLVYMGILLQAGAPTQRTKDTRRALIAQQAKAAQQAEAHRQTHKTLPYPAYSDTLAIDF